jgi:hypothetical protein
MTYLEALETSNLEVIGKLEAALRIQLAATSLSLPVGVVTTVLALYFTVTTSVLEKSRARAGKRVGWECGWENARGCPAVNTHVLYNVLKRSREG